MRTILATLGLGFAGAALTGGVAAAPIAAGLAGGIAGNLATDLFKQLDSQMWDRFLAGWSGIDENHHIVAALRLAELTAVRAILDRYLELQLGEDDRAGQQRADSVVARLGRYLTQEIKRAQRRDLGDATELARLSILPGTFDAALAFRRAPDIVECGTNALAWRAISEAVVLAELRVVCDGADQPLPSLLESVFLGLDEPGWFDLFVRDAADRIASADGAFATIWNAEQVALIRALVDASHATISATDTNVKLLAARFESGLLLLESIGARIDAVRSDLDDIRALLDMKGAETSRSWDRRGNRAGTLPQPPADFVGRSPQRTALAQDLMAGGRGLISAVRGMGGIGKTSLAAIVGRDVAESFPDGAYWLDLKGSRPGFALGPHEALGKLIHQLDLLATLADDPEARAAQFRGLAVGRRLLIILDDARDAAQCASLLPLGGLAIDIQGLDSFPLGAPITMPAGILFCTYATLRSQRHDEASRLQQILDWLGPESDGIIVIDEAHALANAAGTETQFGAAKGSEQGLAGVRLQNALPRARILYLSATGATDPANLCYAARLGLWGTSSCGAIPSPAPIFASASSGSL